MDHAEDGEDLVAQAAALGVEPVLLDLLERIGPALADVVNGALTPGARLELEAVAAAARPLLRRPGTGGVVGAAGVVFDDLLAAVPPGTRLRVLEVRLHAENMVDRLLSRIPAERAEIVIGFSQDDPARRYHGVPFLTTRRFDPAMDPETQGFPQRGFDVVLTRLEPGDRRSLDGLLSRLEVLVAPGGLLLLEDHPFAPPWYQTTFGLVDPHEPRVPRRRRVAVEQILEERGTWAAASGVPAAGVELARLVTRLVVAQAAAHGKTARRAFSVLTEVERERRSRVECKDAGLVDVGGAHPILRKKLASAMPVFECAIDTDLLSYVKDHRVHGSAVLPGAALVEMALAAGREVLGEGAQTIEELQLHRPVLVPDEGATLQLALTPDGSDSAVFRSYLKDGETWRPQAQGTIRRSAEMFHRDYGSVPIVGEGWRDQDTRAFYDQLRHSGVGYGPTFQGIRRLKLRPGEALAWIEPPAGLSVAGEYLFHPALLDACFQTLLAALHSSNGDTLGAPYMLLSVDYIKLMRSPPPEGFWCHATLREGPAVNPESVVADIAVRTEDDSLVAEITDLCARRVSQMSLPDHQVDHMFYQMRWDAGDWPCSGRGGRWLVFADRGGRAERFVQNMKRRGATCLCVGQEGQKGWRTLDPAVDDDSYETLLREAGQVDGVVHFWSLDIVGSDTVTSAEMSASQSLGCLSGLKLLQAVVRAKVKPGFPVYLVTAGAQSLPPHNVDLSPGQAPVWGLGRVARNEHGDICCTLVDLDPTDMDRSIRLLADGVGENTPETEVVFRAGDCYVPRLLRARPPASSRFDNIHADGTYLIVGGLGGLGLVFAQWLLGKGARHLALVGRKRRPEADEAVAALRSGGVEVRVLEADVCSEEDVHRMLEEIGQTMPRLCCVIHSAGVLDDALLSEQTIERFRKVLGPKVLGAWNLHRLTLDHQLDHFCLFSSIAAIVGAPGQANHAAASAFEDLLAHHRGVQALPALSINWGGWGEVGAAAGRLGSGILSGVEPISVRQGIGAMDRVPDSSLQLVIASIDWPRFIESVYSGARPTMLRGMDEASRAVEEREDGDLEAELSAAAPARRKAMVVDRVQAEVVHVLGLTRGAPVDTRRRLMELGLDSLMAVQLRSRLGRLLGRRVPASMAFNYPTIEAIGGYLLKELGLEPDADEKPPEPKQQDGASGKGVLDRFLAEVERDED